MLVHPLIEDEVEEVEVGAVVVAAVEAVEDDEEDDEVEDDDEDEDEDEDEADEDDEEDEEAAGGGGKGSGVLSHTERLGTRDRRVMLNFTTTKTQNEPMMIHACVHVMNSRHAQFAESKLST